MNRKVVITGSSKGIGLATAKRFAANGDTVLIVSRDVRNLERAKKELLQEDQSADLDFYACDVSDSGQIAQLMRYVNNQFGGCDILINNAGIFIPGSIYNEEEGNFNLMMDTNLKSAYELSRALLPQMMQRGNGDIVNVCSIASMTAYSNGGSYSISKYALLGFSKNLREEMKDFGVRVMSILPGAVYTDSWKDVDIDPQRLMPPEDIAQMILSSCNLSRRSVVEELIIRPQLGDL